MTRAWTLGLSIEQAIDDAVRGLAGLSLIPEAETFELDYRKAKVTADWLEAALEGSAKNLLAQARRPFAGLGAGELPAPVGAWPADDVAGRGAHAGELVAVRVRR